MAYIFDHDTRLLLVSCDCGNIIADAPDARTVKCHDCGREYWIVDGEVILMPEGRANL